MIKMRISFKQLNHGYYRHYLNREEYVLLGLLRLLTLKDSSKEESLRGDTTLAGRGITGTLATQMDVEDSSSAFAPATSDAVVLVHVSNPVQPQQSQTSSSSQAATLPSSSAPSLSTPSCCDTSSTYSHVVQSSTSVLIESKTTPPSSISSSVSSKRISRAGSNFQIDPLLRVAVAFNLVTEEFSQEEAIAELIMEEHHEYSVYGKMIQGFTSTTSWTVRTFLTNVT